MLERSHKTNDDEFYHLLEEEPESIAELNQKLREWEQIYNTIRPHASLGYLAPEAYFANTAFQNKSETAILDKLSG